MLASIGYNGCSDINSLHDKYLQRGETIYVAPPDSVKIFSGREKVKITYRNYDPTVGKLTVYWDFRQGSASFDVPADNLGEEEELTILNLQEKHYTFELVATDPSGQYHSIPLNISGQVYGPRYEASLVNRKVGNATIFPLANYKMSIAWASAVGTMAGVELLYRNSSDTETVMKVTNDDMLINITDSKDDAIMYRTFHLPENCIDTFYMEYAPINFAVIDDVRLNRLLCRRWNPPGIPYSAFGSGWEIERLWDGILGNVDPGFLSPGGTNVSVTPWNFTFDMGQLARIRRIKLYPRVTLAQEYVQSHPKKIELWASPTDDVNADLATWIFLGEFNSIKPSGPGPVTAEDTAYARGGEEYFTTDNITAAVRYLRFRIMETWVTPNTTVAIMEIELFGVSQEDLGI